MAWVVGAGALAWSWPPPKYSVPKPMAITRMISPIQPIALGSRRTLFHSGVSDMSFPRLPAPCRQGQASRGLARDDALPRRLFATWGAGLFADAEVAENHVQDILDVDPAGEPPQRPGSEAQLLGQQILAAGELGLERPP